MGVREIDRSLEQWQMGVKDLRRRVILAPTPRERERWYAILLLAQGLTAAATAEALERDPHTIGRWASAFGEGGPGAMAFEQSGGSPRDRQSAADRTEGSGAGVSSKGWPQLGQLELEGGAQICAGTFRGLPEPQQLPELPPSTRGQALHRLGFVLKRPKKRLLKADAAQRETFVAEYAALVDEAQQVEAKVFFVDEAHFRADGDPVSGYGAGSARQMGAQRSASPGGLDQPALGRKGQLLFGGVPGNRRGGMDGTGGQQQLCNLRRFPAATAGAARGIADCDLG